MMQRFIGWRKGRIEVMRTQGLKAARALYNDHFFRWWFRTLEWTGNILDVGCGAGVGTDSPLLTSGKVMRYVGVDPLSGEDIAPGETILTATTRKWVLVRGIGEVMPFVPDAWCSTACAFSVLQHCINPDQLAGEIFRCLKPGGTFYGSVCVRATPERSPLISVDFPDGAAVAAVLRGAGFDVVQEHTFPQGLYCFEAVRP